jgi:hypothetical protein
MLLVTTAVSAQGNLCNPAKASTVDQASGIVVQKVSLSGSWGSNIATVFLPDQEIAEGAVLFSHSTIHENGVSVDLTPLALTLAGAGATVIVPERAIEWPPTDERTNREGAVVICAANWLRENAKLRNNGKQLTDKDNIVIRVGYGYVGPRICAPTSTRDCVLTSPFSWPSQHGGIKADAAYVPLADPTGSVGLGAARWLARWLGLREINHLVGYAQGATRPEVR